MNKHVSKAEVAAADPRPMDVGQACYAVWHADMMLRATTRHPSCEYVYEARKAVYDEAVANLRKVLDNG
jgi:hypothetical protein